MQVVGAPFATISCHSAPSCPRADKAFRASGLFSGMIRTTIDWSCVPDQKFELLASPTKMNLSAPLRITSTAAVLNATFRAPFGPHAGAAVVATLNVSCDIGCMLEVAHAATTAKLTTETKIRKFKRLSSWLID